MFKIEILNYQEESPDNENAGCNNGNYPLWSGIDAETGNPLNGLTCRCGNGCSGTDRIVSDGTRVWLVLQDEANEINRTVLTIRTGFTVSSLFGNGDTDGIDVISSANIYRRLLRAQIEQAYPGADVGVRMGDVYGSGRYTEDLRTTVTLGALDPAKEQEIAETVDGIAERLHNSPAAWMVRFSESFAQKKSFDDGEVYSDGKRHMLFVWNFSTDGDVGVQNQYNADVEVSVWEGDEFTEPADLPGLTSGCWRPVTGFNVDRDYDGGYCWGDYARKVYETLDEIDRFIFDRFI